MKITLSAPIVLALLAGLGSTDASTSSLRGLRGLPVAEERTSSASNPRFGRQMVDIDDDEDFEDNISLDIDSDDIDDEDERALRSKSIKLGKSTKAKKGKKGKKTKKKKGKKKMMRKKRVPKSTPAPVVPATARQTVSPTASPTVSPTDAPTVSPTDAPTVSHTDAPTATQTATQFILTRSPTSSPTDSPTDSPTNSPTDAPTTASPAPPSNIRVSFIGNGHCVDASGSDFFDYCSKFIKLSEGEAPMTEGECKEAALSTPGALGYEYEMFAIGYNGFQECKIFVEDISRASCPVSSGFVYATGQGASGMRWPSSTRPASSSQRAIEHTCYSFQPTTVIPTVSFVGEGPCLDSNGAEYHYCYQGIDLDDPYYSSYSEQECLMDALNSPGALGYEYADTKYFGTGRRGFCKVLLPASPSDQTNCPSGFNPAAGPTTTNGGYGYPLSTGFFHQNYATDAHHCWSFAGRN